MTDTMMTRAEQRAELKNIRHDFINAIVAEILPYHSYDRDIPLNDKVLFEKMTLDTLAALVRALQEAPLSNDMIS